MSSDQDPFRGKEPDTVLRQSDNLMSEESKTRPGAWNPFTPRGIARFAAASTARLLLVQAIFAAVVGGSFIWFLAINYAPMISRALQQLPEEARLSQGKLTGVESGLLADGQFLSLTIDLEESSEAGTADIQVKLREQNVEVCSLFDCLSFDYPANDVSLGRSVSDPWWGAWQPAILAGIGLLFAVVVAVSWAILALLYLFPVRLLAYFADRKLSAMGSWRVACAAQLPGALFVAIAIVLYGLQVLDLVRFLIFWGLHFVISWIYVFISPFFLEKLETSSGAKSNPFTETAKKKI